MRVTGVMIAEGTPIYRDDAQLKEHYVIFKAGGIDRMRNLFHKKNMTNSLNEMHDMEKMCAGANRIEDWFVDPPAGKIEPTALSNQGIREGSWIATYQIEDPLVWKKVKDGTFNGFSVEGM